MADPSGRVEASAVARLGRATGAEVAPFLEKDGVARAEYCACRVQGQSVCAAADLGSSSDHSNSHHDKHPNDSSDQGPHSSNGPVSFGLEEGLVDLPDGDKGAH
jgi:hypothetical protein